MEFTMQEVVIISDTLRGILQKELPISASFKLARITKLFQEERKTYEEQRGKLVMKYGDKDEKTGNTQVRNNEMTKFQEEMKVMMSENIKLDIKPVKLEDFGNEVKISPIDILGLEKIIIE